MQGTGGIEFYAAVQLADVRSDNPDDWTTVGTAESGAGDKCLGNLPMPTGHTASFLVRFGVGYKLTGSATHAQADVGLQVSYNQCGNVVGARTMQLDAASTDGRIETLTGWLPAVGVSKVRAAYVVSDLAGGFPCRLTYRTASDIPESPSAWSTAIDSYRTANGEYNTDDISLMLSNAVWVQLGMLYNSSSGFGSATVSAAAATQSS